VFIDNPDNSYIKSEDLERFKRLSGLEELHVDIEAARLQLGVSFHDNCVLNNSMKKKVDNECSGRFYTFPDKVHVAQGVSDATTHRHQGG